MTAELDGDVLCAWSGWSGFFEYDNALPGSLDEQRLAHVRHIVVQLAQLGAQNLSAQKRCLLHRDISALYAGDEGVAAHMPHIQGAQVVPCGVYKYLQRKARQAAHAVKEAAHKVEKFVRHHDKEILIGAGVLVGVAAVVGIAAAVTAAGAAAAAGGDRKKPPPDEPKAPPTPTPQPAPQPDVVLSNPEPGGQASRISMPPLSAACGVLGTLVTNVGDKSRTYQTEGACKPHLHIGYINGMSTSFAEAQQDAAYIGSFASRHSIQGVYNQDHGVLGNLAEIFAMNYSGYSPNTSGLLQQEWTKFHEAHKGDPHVKLLHFCHSQGAIHTKNALKNCPQEIRDRVIVVAIAPAAVIPKALCYNSFNYASKKDVVPHGEMVMPSLLNTREFGEDNSFDMALENRAELIWLDPHPDVKELIDHDIISATFAPQIERHAMDYMARQGEYK